MNDHEKPAFRCAPLMAASLAGMIVSACGSGSPFPSTFSSPFSSSNVVDQTFISAAQTWDMDKNGSVTCAEWTGYVSTLLKESDANADNALDAAEFDRVIKSDRLFEVANLAYYDGNADGRVTLEELTGKQNRAFALLDKNGDCQLDRNESVRVHGVDKPKATEAPPDNRSARQ